MTLRPTTVRSMRASGGNFSGLPSKKSFSGSADMFTKGSTAIDPGGAADDAVVSEPSARAAAALPEAAATRAASRCGASTNLSNVK